MFELNTPAGIFYTQMFLSILTENMYKYFLINWVQSRKKGLKVVWKGWRRPVAVFSNICYCAAFEEERCSPLGLKTKEEILQTFLLFLKLGVHSSCHSVGGSADSASTPGWSPGPSGPEPACAADAPVGIRWNQSAICSKLSKEICHIFLKIKDEPENPGNCISWQNRGSKAEQSANVLRKEKIKHQMEKKIRPSPPKLLDHVLIIFPSLITVKPYWTISIIFETHISETPKPLAWSKTPVKTRSM